jgi:hypothetical protein
MDCDTKNHPAGAQGSRRRPLNGPEDEYTSKTDGDSCTDTMLPGTGGRRASTDHSPPPHRNTSAIPYTSLDREAKHPAQRRVSQYGWMRIGEGLLSLACGAGLVAITREFTNRTTSLVISVAAVIGFAIGLRRFGLGVAALALRRRVERLLGEKMR